MFSNYFFAVYEIIWKYTEEPDTPQLTVWRSSFVCCIPKATNTHNMQYLLALQQWLHERTSLLRKVY
jgi:hypothetical protein